MNHSDHSEARERARQDDVQAYLEWFEKEYPLLTLGGFKRMELQPAWLAGRRSLEQERWIAVEERLPTFEAWVDVVIDGCVQICPAQFDGELWNWYVEEADPAPKTSVSHWRKRPAPPVHKGDS